MNIQEWLDKVAFISTIDLAGEEVPVWKSKYDNSYITHVGMEDNIKFLADREITEKLTHGVGFSPKDQKWYGWSHRAIYGFQIGSTCKKGHCHYRAANEEDEIEAAINFWKDEYNKNVSATKERDGLIIVTWIYTNDVPNETLRGTTGTMDWIYDPDNWGHGEWTAKTMDDARQMAIDFNQGVS